MKQEKLHSVNSDKVVLFSLEGVKEDFGFYEKMSQVLTKYEVNPTEMFEYGIKPTQQHVVIVCGYHYALPVTCVVTRNKDNKITGRMIKDVFYGVRNMPENFTIILKDFIVGINKFTGNLYLLGKDQPMIRA